MKQIIAEIESKISPNEIELLDLVAELITEIIIRKTITKPIETKFKRV